VAVLVAGVLAAVLPVNAMVEAGSAGPSAVQHFANDFNANAKATSLTLSSQLHKICLRRAARVSRGSITDDEMPVIQHAADPAVKGGPQCPAP
tara:strand:- start:1047 stop:1325 length:279 start_codon:yes stop_codon:yes gene_type:complete